MGLFNKDIQSEDEKQKIAWNKNYFIKAVMATAFAFSIGLYLAYSFCQSTEFLMKIVFTMLLGVVLGLIVSFKLDKEKTEYLVMFAFILAFMSGIIFTMVVGKDIRLSNIDLFTPDEYSLVLIGITVVTGIMGFISGCILCIAFKNFTQNGADDIKTNGYLICNKCGGYYQLQLGESANDFGDKCACGGYLEYKKEL